MKPKEKAAEKWADEHDDGNCPTMNDDECMFFASCLKCAFLAGDKNGYERGLNAGLAKSCEGCEALGKWLYEHPRAWRDKNPPQIQITDEMSPYAPRGFSSNLSARFDAVRKKMRDNHQRKKKVSNFDGYKPIKDVTP